MNKAEVPIPRNIVLLVESLSVWILSDIDCLKIGEFSSTLLPIDTSVSFSGFSIFIK